MAASTKSIIEGKIFDAIQNGIKDADTLKQYIKRQSNAKDLDAITAEIGTYITGEKQNELNNHLSNQSTSAAEKLTAIGSLVFSNAEAQEDDQPSALQSAAQKQKYDEEALKPRNAELDNLEQNDIRQNADGALQIQTDKYGKVADNRRMGQKLFDKIYRPNEGGLINLNKKVTYTPGTTTNPVGWKSTHHETSKGFYENALRAGVPCPMYNSKEKLSSAVSLMQNFMLDRDQKIKELYENHLTANQDKQGSDLAINSSVASNDKLEVANNEQAPSITTTNRNLLSPQEWHNVNLKTFKQQVEPGESKKLSNQQIKDMTATYIKTLTPEHVVKLAEKIAEYEEKNVVKEKTCTKQGTSSSTKKNEKYNVTVKERTGMPEHLQYIEDALFKEDVTINRNARAVIKDGKIKAKEHASGWNQKIQNSFGNRNTSNDKEQIAQLVRGVCKESKIEPNSIYNKGDQDQKYSQPSGKSQSKSDAQKLDKKTLDKKTLLETFVRNNTTDFNNKGSQAVETVQKEQVNSSESRQKLQGIDSSNKQRNQSSIVNQ
jgi:hypothetical protein